MTATPSSRSAFASTESVPRMMTSCTASTSDDTRLIKSPVRASLKYASDWPVNLA